MEIAARRVAARAEDVLKIIAARSSRFDLLQMVENAMPALDREMTDARYFAVPQAFIVLTETTPSFAAALAAMFLRDSVARLADHPVPDVLANEFEFQAMRILDACSQPASDAWSLANDVVRKELFFCRLEMFPCRAQLVEKNSGIPISWLPRQDFATFGRLCAMLSSQGMRRKPYFESHTHAVMLKNFNEAGWTAFYGFVAELMKLYPDRLGLIGSAWFYDPQIPTLSPRLAYLRRIPLSGGAIVLKGTSGEEDIALATATSPTRREAYEAGRYLPTCYTMIWPRKALLRWAENASGPRGAA